MTIQVILITEFSPRVTNPYNSISQYFVNQANTVLNTEFNDYQYDMAYQTYIIDPHPTVPNQFVSMFLLAEIITKIILQHQMAITVK